MIYFSPKYFADSPVFVKQPQDVTGDSGDRVTLECLVDSNPPGEYTWIRNNLSSTTKVTLILPDPTLYLIPPGTFKKGQKSLTLQSVAELLS